MMSSPPSSVPLHRLLDPFHDLAFSSTSHISSPPPWNHLSSPALPPFHASTASDLPPSTLGTAQLTHDARPHDEPRQFDSTLASSCVFPGIGADVFKSRYFYEQLDTQDLLDYPKVQQLEKTRNTQCADWSSPTVQSETDGLALADEGELAKRCAQDWLLNVLSPDLFTQESDDDSKSKDGELEPNISSGHTNTSKETEKRKAQERNLNNAPKQKKLKPLLQPRYALETKSDVDVLDDGYKWRKYGQKAVKNSPHPRSYYRCTFHKCPVKKRVERSAHDSGIVVTTYQGMHTHYNPTTNESTINFPHVFQLLPLGETGLVIPNEALWESIIEPQLVNNVPAKCEFN